MVHRSGSPVSQAQKLGPLRPNTVVVPAHLVRSVIDLCPICAIALHVVDGSLYQVVVSGHPNPTMDLPLPHVYLTKWHGRVPDRVVVCHNYARWADLPKYTAPLNSN